MRLTATLVITASLAAMLLSAAAHGQMYRWTDEQGRVHYSDTPPPEAARQERRVLDERGITRQTLDRPRTPEEIEEVRRLEAEEEERRRVRAERERRDRVLLHSFGSERELITARDERVAMIDGVLGLTDDNIRGLEDQIQSLQRRRELIEARGQEPPEGLDDDIASLERQIQLQLEFREERRQERTRIIEQFNADLVRLRELKAAGR